MLEFAIKFKDDIQKLYMDVVTDKKYRFAFAYNYINFDLDIKQTTFKNEQYISRNKETGKIHGYMEAFIDREYNYIDELFIWAAPNNDPFEFGCDLMAFFNELLPRYNKVNFSCLIGNDTEGKYDKLIRIFGGRIVGTFKEHTVTNDGKLRDRKYYEILRSEFIEKHPEGIKFERRLTPEEIQEVTKIAEKLIKKYQLKNGTSRKV